MPRHRCARTRSLASQGLDGELSEAEAAVLRRHLARCPECSAFLETVDGIATLVRSAPLEPFSLEPVSRSRRPGTTRTLRRVAIAAAAVIVASPVVGILGSVSRSQAPSPVSPSVTSVGNTLPVEPTGTARRGIPVVRRLFLPLGQRNASNDF